jgi:hypothetical protein
VEEDYELDREGQEYGVTTYSGDLGNFRPATREFYDSQQWSVVPAGGSVSEIPTAETLEFAPLRPRLRNSDE